METFISERDVAVRIRNHPDFTEQEKNIVLSRYRIVTQQDKSTRSHNTRQSNNGKKRLQLRQDY